jgi:hypothetical protein
MKEDETTLRRACFPGSGPHARDRSFVAVSLCLVLGTSLMTGCMLGPAVGVLTAVTQASVLVSAVEQAVRVVHEGVSIVVQNETEVYTGPGDECSKIGRLNKGVEVRLVASRGDWLMCSSDLFGKGWIHASSAPDISPQDL